MCHLIRIILRILSKVQTFMQGRTQINLNVMKTLDELKTSIVRIESRLNVREKETLPAQTQPNPKGQFDVKNSNSEQANVVTTIRSGKVIETPMKVHEPGKSLKLKSSDSHIDTQDEQSEIDKKMHAPFPHRLLSAKQLADHKDILDVFQHLKININSEQANVVTTIRSGKVIETPMKVHEPGKSLKLKSSDSHIDTQDEQSEIDKKMHAPFPHRLLSAKQLADHKDILDVFQHLKINIPLLSVIKQVPAYSKFLKDLCTVNRKHNIQKKAFLTEQETSSHLEAKVPLEACLPNLLDFDEDGS
ncbi:uncharacterized protein LOC113281448 isoform X2 [Papaver somniferum]|uniref:uncharacterized protein LOC113281448 isoform X2 n=1 Tax=Papaver somniferum TaxID=3469 RepID=UPI000E6F491C|nr:uncharacterized protein LOC113281448 isoform X2 [Papaver somniferum]